jgi:dynein heavy chain
MRAAKEKGERELAATEALVAELTATLAEANAAKKEKEDDLKELQRLSAEMTRKLTAASQLMTGLGGEQRRWAADMGTIKEDKIKLIGDCLTGSAFLSYCGPFNSILRQKMIYETWKGDLDERGLPCHKDDFQLATFLSSEVEISQWAADGLPSDELSV